jgi:formylglycine-generating enzyme required for sulfatase activity
VSEGALAMAYQLLSELVYMDGRSAEQRQRDVLFASELAEDAGWYRLESGGAMFKRLRDDLAEALVPVVEGTTLPAKERVQAGVYLGWLGDPRPGVCTLPPDMVQIEGGEFVIGETSSSIDMMASQRQSPYEQGMVRRWYRSTRNDHSLTVPQFEIARYLVTNAQWRLFIDDDGYNPDASWWDNAGQAWLLRDDQMVKGLKPHQQRDHKQHPEWWDREYGITRPNYPLVGISWYEAMAFCRWLTQNQIHNPEGYRYNLPSEAEWEYTARQALRRTYAWGNEPLDTECANFNQAYRGTTAVGCFAPGAAPDYYLYDLTGNVWEWTRSEYRDYPYDPDDGREDIHNPVGKSFVMRGGGWNNNAVYLYASSRDYFRPDTYSTNVGFRLVRHVPPDKA